MIFTDLLVLLRAKSLNFFSQGGDNDSGMAAEHEVCYVTVDGQTIQSLTIPKSCTVEQFFGEYVYRITVFLFGGLISIFILCVVLI